MLHDTPDPNPDNPSNRQRAWLASILLRSQQTWFGRFIWQLRRLSGMGRGQRRRLQRRAALSLAGAALVLSLGANLMRPVTVHAASITVDVGEVEIADNGYCSLIEAILNANDDSQVYASAGECAAGSGADTINLPNTLFLLDNVYGNSYYSDNGLPDITSDITIEGFGSEIRRNGPAPAFRILAVSTTGDLTLNNTTISYGDSAEDGGGLYVAGYALIQASTFEYNVAYDDGGAIEVDVGGTLIIDNSTIRNNDAGELGGGVSAEDGATLTIRNLSVISGNYAAEGGGGVMADGSGLVTIDNSSITGNSTDYFGGGIATYQSEIVIQNNSTISNNDSYLGGGADFYLSDVTITDSTISGNYGFLQGGGLHLDGSQVTIARSTISDNHTGPYIFPFFGGGIFVGFAESDPECEVDCDFVYSDLIIVESTISGNSAFGGGGIMNYFGNRVGIYKSTLTDNEATLGGGLLNYFGTWAIVNSTVSGNRAVSYSDFDGDGGGILNISTPDEREPFPLYQSLVLSTVTGNYAEGVGGGLLNEYGIVGVFGSIVSGNTSGENTGNEIYNSDEGNAYVGSFGSLLGHGGETTAEALYNHIPGPDTLLLTTDGLGPIPLTSILDTNLGDNGGPTETHALVADSPAVDYLPESICSLATPFGDLIEDQRSEPRNIDIPGMGNDGNDEVCDIGAYELQGAASGAFCPVDGVGVGYLRTDALGIGQGSPTKGFRTRKLVIPNSNDVASLYGQLAALDIGVMKYVRFLPQGEPKIQIHPPTSLAYRPHAISWWGSDIPAEANWVKGQFFWGAKANKSPRAFVLWPTYETDEPYANAFVTFDESTENHVSWEPGFIPTQVQTVAIPEVQEDGATVNVTVALVDVNKDNRSVTLTVEAGDVSEARVVTQPNKGLLLNLEEFELQNVDAGTDEVIITLESEEPDGDSAAMIGAAANYWCGEEELPEPIPGPDSAAQSSGFWNSVATQFAQLRSQQAAAAGERQADGGSGRFWSQWRMSREDAPRHWADRGDDR